MEIEMFSVGATIRVRDKLQEDYSYSLEAPAGRDFAHGFEPRFTPAEMLKMGVFEGKYCNDCRDEFPADWFDEAKLSERPDIACNYFGVKSRQSLSTWRAKGWIIEPDPRGWFQWYCRYYLGRRISGVDDKQIARWRSFARHHAQVRANCDEHDLTCRPRQRQALLQWSYDCFI